MLNKNIDRFLDEVLNERNAVKLHEFLEGYRLSAKSEGKSPNTIAIVEASVRYLNEFLTTNNLSTNVGEIAAQELRHFIVYLKEQPRFAHHRFTRPQGGHLSGHTINGYLRALQAFWSWLEREDLIEENPFARLKIPKTPITPRLSAMKIEREVILASGADCFCSLRIVDSLRFPIGQYLSL